MKLTVLGSGGWIPTQNRQTCSYLLELDNSLIILDAGTGISRLSEYSDILSKYKEIHLILSHYHLDHIIGLSFLPLFIKNHKLNIYAPSKSYYENTALDILKTITSFPYFSKPIETLTSNVNIYEYDSSGFKINDLNISILEQKHTAPSFGITLGKYLHYATDTSVFKETFILANKVDLLLHECWQIKNSKSSAHSSLEEIFENIKHCKNTKIGLIHINPSWREENFNEVLEKIENTNIYIVEDSL